MIKDPTAGDDGEPRIGEHKSFVLRSGLLPQVSALKKCDPLRPISAHKVCGTAITLGRLQSKGEVSQLRCSATTRTLIVQLLLLLLAAMIVCIDYIRGVYMQ